ncbi:hypothetical protein N431DRAFT_351636, partial [Stipitochalara longipes BDJ]
IANILIPRRALSDLSLNIIHGKELTLKIRGEILGIYIAGYKILYIIVRLK